MTSSGIMGGGAGESERKFEHDGCPSDGDSFDRNVHIMNFFETPPFPTGCFFFLHTIRKF